MYKILNHMNYDRAFVKENFIQSIRPIDIENSVKSGLTEEEAIEDARSMFRIFAEKRLKYKIGELRYIPNLKNNLLEHFTAHKDEFDNSLGHWTTIMKAMLGSTGKVKYRNKRLDKLISVFGANYVFSVYYTSLVNTYLKDGEAKTIVLEELLPQEIINLMEGRRKRRLELTGDFLSGRQYAKWMKQLPVELTDSIIEEYTGYYINYLKAYFHVVGDYGEFELIKEMKYTASEYGKAQFGSASAMATYFGMDGNTYSWWNKGKFLEDEFVEWICDVFNCTQACVYGYRHIHKMYHYLNFKSYDINQKVPRFRKKSKAYDELMELLNADMVADESFTIEY